MHYSINIADWFALAPGLSSPSDWQAWSAQNNSAFTGELPKYKKIPMMAARRMSAASRLAVETGLQLIDQSVSSDAKKNQTPDAAIFISRHGELERTYKIVHSLAQQQDISPTDFAMSVHNTAAGLFTITAKQTLPVSSLAAGIDGFQQGLLEAQAMLTNGAKRVLMIDFDGLIPDAYHNAMNEPPVNFCYAAGFIISQGEQLRCRQIIDSQAIDNDIDKFAEGKSDIDVAHDRLPQSLEFLRNWLNGKDQFVVQGVRSNWQWNRYF